jgi:hypothetical protein
MDPCPPSFVGPIGNLRDLRRFEIVGRVLRKKKEKERKRKKKKKKKKKKRENFVEEEALGKLPPPISLISCQFNVQALV